MGYLLEKASQLPTLEISRIAQTFMLPKHQLKGTLAYLQTFFTGTGRLIVEMISLIMGFNSSEYVDDIT